MTADTPNNTPSGNEFPAAHTTERVRDRERLGNLIPLGFDKGRDGVENVREAADRILASDWLAEYVAARVAEAKAEAWDEGWEHLWNECDRIEGGGLSKTDNPYSRDHA